MKRWGILCFGLFSYAMFLGVFLYSIGFVGNFLVPTTLDGPAEVPLGRAVLTNAALMLVFALQHSVMARPAFKRWWTQYIPVAMERSVYVLCTNLALILLFCYWEPMGLVVWNVTETWARAVIYGLYAWGWVTVLVTTCLINHFDLFGLRQVWLNFQGRPYTSLGFVTPGPYRIVRHPLYIGWLTVFWAAPTMTAAHLLFALGISAYILIAIRFEERDLIQHHGKKYIEYRYRVPMLIPSLWRRQATSGSLASDASQPANAEA